MATRLVLEILDLDTCTDDVRVFHESPVAIGSALENAIRIDDPRVAERHGLLFFTPRSIKFVDCSPASGLHEMEVVGLVPRVPFQIGPVQLRARIEDCPDAPIRVTERRAGLTLLVDEMDLIFRSVALTACAVSCGNARSRADIAKRAMQLLGVVTSLAAELRRSDHALWVDGAELREPMTELCDPLAITDFLLDPDGSVLRLDDLRSRFIDLARWESMAPLALGTA